MSPYIYISKIGLPNQQNRYNFQNKNPTFNSKFDRGLYWFPSQGGKTRFHPTQKSLKLFEALKISSLLGGVIKE